MAVSTKKKTVAEPSLADVKIPAMGAVEEKPKNLFSALLNKVQKSGGVAKVDGRPIISLSIDEQSKAKEYFQAKILEEFFDERKETLGKSLKESIFEKWVQSLYQGKARPENPKIVLTHNGKPLMEGMFIVQEKMKINVLSQEEPEESTINYFVKVGISKEKAEQLVKNELNFEPPVDIPLGFLRNGGKIDGKQVVATADMKSAAEKLLSLFTTDAVVQFTEAERSAVQSALKIRQTFSVKEGFLDRVATYCGSEEQLSAVFAIITPVLMLKGGQFLEGVAKSEQNTLLIGFASTLLEEKLG